MKYKHKGMVELFPQKGGWFYVVIPPKITQELTEYEDRGLIAIVASVGATSWNTSLLPMGDGTHFVAINKKVMKAQGLGVGSEMEIVFGLRKREKDVC